MKIQRTVSWLWVSLLFVLATKLCFAENQAVEPGQKDFSEEPPELFVLSVGDQKFHLYGEANQQIVLDNKSYSVALAKKSFRTFSYGGITFNYPTEYRFAFSNHQALKIWELSGTFCRMMVQRYRKQDEKTLLNNFSQELQKDYGAKDAKVEPIHLQLNNNELTGNRFLVHVANHEVIQDIFVLAGQKNSFIIILQRNAVTGKAEYAAADKEMQHLKALLDESLKF